MPLPSFPPEVTATGFTPAELKRYSRHLILPELGVVGQQRLKSARVLIVGAGGLGSPVGMYLAAAGIGTIGLVDFDSVDESNLHRQILYRDADIGRPKLEAAIERLQAINPHTQFVPHSMRIDRTNALELVGQYDIVVDGTDNFPSRYLINDACVLAGKPNVYGSIFRFEGQVSLFFGAEGPCYRCLFTEPPPPELVPSCAEGGVLGVLPGIIGCLQANETIKFIAGIGNTMLGRLLLFDALRMRFHQVELTKNPTCPICSANPSITELIDYQTFCGVTTEDQLPRVAQVSPKTAYQWLAANTARLLDVRTCEERDIAIIPGSVTIPVAELDQRLAELAEDERWIVHCHKGPRSTRAARLMGQAGFRQVFNLEGGIEAWSREIDHSIPRY